MVSCKIEFYVVLRQLEFTYHNPCIVTANKKKQYNAGYFRSKSYKRDKFQFLHALLTIYERPSGTVILRKKLENNDGLPILHKDVQ